MHKPKSEDIGTALRPKYLRHSYMDPLGMARRPRARSIGSCLFACARVQAATHVSAELVLRQAQSTWREPQLQVSGKPTQEKLSLQMSGSTLPTSHMTPKEQHSITIGSDSAWTDSSWHALRSAAETSRARSYITDIGGSSYLLAHAMPLFGYPILGRILQPSSWVR